jgi:hypothetical protein
MLTLAARHADGWLTAWHGHPSDRSRGQLARLLTAWAEEGRARPLDVYVGMEVKDRPDRVRLDPPAIADALGAWAAEGAAQVQVLVKPATLATFGTLLDAAGRDPPLARLTARGRPAIEGRVGWSRSGAPRATDRLDATTGRTALDPWGRRNHDRDRVATCARACVRMRRWVRRADATSPPLRDEPPGSTG